MIYKLSDICDYVTDKIEIDQLNEYTYISTENMQPNKCGIVKASSLPSTKQVQAFKRGDVLVSNIRPYFKKIYYADFDGGCSNDVLIFRAKHQVCQSFLYYVLSDDKFFEYSTANSKGTKMPRGNKIALMNYEVPKFGFEVQKKIAMILETIDRKIKNNMHINNNLMA